MLHICDLNNFYSLTGGGVKTYHHHKMEYVLARDDVEYTLFLPSDHEAIEHRSSRARVVHFPAVKGDDNYRFMVNARRMRRILKRFKPDVIEVGSPYVLPWTVRRAAKGLNAHVVGFWHADYPITYVHRALQPYGETVAAAGREFAWWYARQTYGRFAATFAAADCIVEGLWDNGIPHVYQTPLGVDVTRFHHQHRDQALRDSVGATGDRPLLFFPHRLLEEKGLSALLEAFPHIHAAHQPVLVFAGVGPGLNRLEAFMAEQADVHYLGYINDAHEMARWYASADAAFALSAFETFGLSAAEAMASGNALIGANAGAVREFIERADCGVLVPYNDAEALAAQTNALLASGRLAQCGRNARDYVARHYSWDAAFDRLFGFYRELAAHPNPRALPPEPRLWARA